MAKKSKKIHKKIYQYTAIFEPQEDGGYTVLIPALPGCVSEGETFEKALKNIKEAAELYLEVKDKYHELPVEKPGVIIAPLQIQI